MLRYARAAAALVCTPNHLHESHVVAALAAGLHVLCERPLALTAAGVERVLKASERYGKRVIVGMNHRFRSDVQAVRSFLAGGELGTIQAVRGGWHTFQPARQLPKPVWEGLSLEGRTILLWCEQGLGDAIQFVRFAALLKERGARVVLECPRLLVPLFSTCEGIDALVAEGEQLPAFDAQVPLMSLPGLLGTTLATIPASVPYLAAEPAKLEQWRASQCLRSVQHGMRPKEATA